MMLAKANHNAVQQNKTFDTAQQNLDWKPLVHAV